MQFFSVGFLLRLVGMCACRCFSPNFYLFISFCQPAYTSHIFSSIWLSFQLCRQSSFELFSLSLSVFAMHVTQKRCTSNDTKYVAFYFILKMGKIVVFNKFLSLQSQMDRLKLVNRKCTSVQCAHLAALECFGTMQNEKCGERERENELFACFTSTNAHFLFITRLHVNV